MSPPLVTVICLCYNQSRFVVEAIQSVLNQRYQNIQLIVVDDASSDNSVSVIKEFIAKHPAIEFISLQTNNGNCKAFNQGLERAKGEYLIDFAADDVLLPNRIERGVQTLQQAGNEYGVHFSDAEIIDDEGNHLSFHSERVPHERVPSGDIYRHLINRYFICPTSLMFKREVIQKLNGYDGNLLYEDFDFLIRSSRLFKYAYSAEVLVKKRIAKNAMAKGQFVFFSKYSRSTFKVCEKILRLNRTEEERKALSERIFYEAKLNLRLLNFGVVIQYFFLWFRNVTLNLSKPA
jgi:glycosyltransferase involved in cell wall biosynthesis